MLFNSIMSFLSFVALLWVMFIAVVRSCIMVVAYGSASSGVEKVSVSCAIVYFSSQFFCHTAANIPPSVMMIMAAARHRAVRLVFLFICFSSFYHASMAAVKRSSISAGGGVSSCISASCRMNSFASRISGGTSVLRR